MRILKVECDCGKKFDDMSTLIGHMLLSHGIAVNASSIRISGNTIRYDELSEKDLEFGYYPIKEIKELHGRSKVK